MPNALPETTPAVPTLAVAGALLLHVPPVVASLSVVAYPRQRPENCSIADGGVSTVAGMVAMQPVGKVYVISVVPDATPETTPVVVPTVAISALLVLHVPPGVASLNVAEDNGQIFTLPDIVAGRGLTVSGIVAVQPVDSE